MIKELCGFQRYEMWQLGSSITLNLSREEIHSNATVFFLKGFPMARGGMAR